MSSIRLKQFNSQMVSLLRDCSLIGQREVASKLAFYQSILSAVAFELKQAVIAICISSPPSWNVTYRSRSSSMLRGACFSRAPFQHLQFLCIRTDYRSASLEYFYPLSLHKYANLTRHEVGVTMRR